MTLAELMTRARLGGAVDERWMHSVLATHIADLVAQVATGDALGDVAADEREWFLKQAEILVREAVDRTAALRLDAEAERYVADGEAMVAERWRNSDERHR